MKKVLFLLCLVTALLLLPACGGDEPEGCGSEHTYGEPFVVTAPTCALPGQTRRNCLYCSAYITESTAAVAHAYDENDSCTMCGRYIDDNMMFELNEDGVSYRVLRYNNTSATSVTIPAAYRGKPVTSIASNAFFDCRQLTEINLPATIKEIGEKAFSNCHALASITLPEGLTTVGRACFSSCRALASISLPSTLTAIATQMFEGCDSLTEITLPAGITEIGDKAFTHCPQLTSVTALGELTRIGFETFRYCGVLESFSAAGTPAIGNAAFKDCKRLYTLEIPAGISAVGEEAFSGCIRLHSITLAPALTAIGTNAFSGCVHLAEVRNFSALVLSVGSSDHGGVARYARNSAIADPEMLTGIEQVGDFFLFFEEYTSTDGGEPARVYILIDYIGNEHSPLIPTPTENGFSIIEYRIASRAFYNSEIVFAALPEGVTVIEDGAFYECNHLLSLTIPFTTQAANLSITFDCRKLAEIINRSRIDFSAAEREFAVTPYAGFLILQQDLDFPLEVTTASAIRNENGVLYYDDTTTVHGTIFRYILGYIGTDDALVIPDVPADGIYEHVIIRAYAFQGTTFTSVTIPSGVTEIAMEAFVGATLGNVVIPETVKTIGDCAFANTRYTSLTVPATTLCHNILGHRSNAKYGEDGYQRAGGLLVFASPTISGAVTLGEDTTNIGSWAFENCTEITSIILSEGVKTIGGNAFRGCTALTEISIPKSVTRLAATILNSCRALERITYGGTVSEWLALTNENPLYGTMSSGTTAGVTVECSDGIILLDAYGNPAE